MSELAIVLINMYLSLAYKRVHNITDSCQQVLKALTSFLTQHHTSLTLYPFINLACT